ncbi:MAG: ATP-binding protein [Leptospirales bacterium]
MVQGYPIIAITGPRQSGKTTLVRMMFPDKPYVSLEDLDERAFANGDPRGFLGRFPDGAILDEVQHCPDLFSYLQTAVDLDNRFGRYILTGSQQFGLLNGIAQSLSGRVAIVSLLPFALDEVQSANQAPESIQELLFKGLYPPVYDRPLDPSIWYGNYLHTYIERDLRQIVNVRDLGAFQLFVRMCATRSGQLINLSSLANDCGITHNTAKSWISTLETSYILYLLRPYHRNFGKRLIKTPKLYFYDTGLLCRILGVERKEQLTAHAQLGAIFETWVVNELLKSRSNLALEPHLYFWRDRVGHEVDVVIERGESLVPVEIKAGQTVSRDYFKGLDLWKEMAGALAPTSWVIYAGQSAQIRDGHNVIPWTDISRLLEHDARD